MADNNLRKHLSFSEQERLCQWLFDTHGPFFHMCSSEFSEIIFTREADYKAGMTIFGLCLRCVEDVKAITFQIMSTHLHAVLEGREDSCKCFFRLFRKCLSEYFKAEGRVINLSLFDCRLFPVRDLKGLRARIVYDNRNGYLACPDHTPFSYKWGANSFFFNPEAVARHCHSAKEMTMREKRSVLHSHVLDMQSGLGMIDGYLSPVCYCDLALGEALFRNARHYFHAVSKEIESYKEVAEEAGSGIFYTDEELFSAVWAICAKEYDGQQPSILRKDEKLELARRIHYDYNASNRQIARILRLDNQVVDRLFPMKAETPDHFKPF